MSEKIKKNEKAKKQTWRAGNMLYPVPAVMVSCARKGEKPNIITVHGLELYALIRRWFLYL